MTDIFDAINLNTRMTGMWAGKPPTLPYGYRPEVSAGNGDAPVRKRSVKEVFAQFAAGNHGG